MYKILKREDLTPNIHLYKFEAPEVARKAQPGQFVVIRIDESGERIPLTVADWDEKEGSVTMVCMEVGTTTQRLATLGTGDAIADFVGPLGNPTEIEKFHWATRRKLKNSAPSAAWRAVSPWRWSCPLPGH